MCIHEGLHDLRVAEQEGMIELFEIDSAGLGDWHVGQAPDTRAQSAAQRRGLETGSDDAVAAGGNGLARSLQHELLERQPYT